MGLICAGFGPITKQISEKVISNVFNPLYQLLLITFDQQKKSLSEFSRRKISCSDFAKTVSKKQKSPPRGQP